MSNSEPSAIVLQRIPCMCGLYISFDSNGEDGSLKMRLIYGIRQVYFYFMKPNFSGDWILDLQASILSSNAAAFQSGGMLIDHREPTFNFKIRMVANRTPVERAGEILSDGVAVGGGESLTSLSWDGDALVMASHSQGPVPWAMSFRYELLEEGRRLRAVEQIRGGGRDQDNIWIFHGSSN
jgi:hypothetical protein